MPDALQVRNACESLYRPDRPKRRTVDSTSFLAKPSHHDRIAPVPRAAHAPGSLSILAVLVGLAGSLAAIGFVEAFDWLNHRLLVSPFARVQFEGERDVLVAATILVPASCGILVGFIFNRFTDAGTPHTPSDVISSVAVGRPFPSFRSALASTFGAIAALGTGTSVGQYGPMVVMGAAIGNLVSSLKVKIETASSVAIACGVAAAISTAFNAPQRAVLRGRELDPPADPDNLGRAADRQKCLGDAGERRPVRTCRGFHRLCGPAGPVGAVCRDHSTGSCPQQRHAACRIQRRAWQQHAGLPSQFALLRTPRR